MSRISTNRSDAIRVVYSGNAKSSVAHQRIEYTTRHQPTERTERQAIEGRAPRVTNDEPS